MASSASTEPPVRDWWLARRGVGRAALAGAVLLVGLVLSGGSAVALQRAQNRLESEALDRRTDTVRAAAATEAGRYVDLLRAVAAAVGAQPDITAADFAAITAPMTRERLSGATGISFVVPSRLDQIARVQQDWRNRGSTGLELKPDDNGRDEHRFVVLTRSLDPQSTFLGADTTTAPEPTEAQDIARDTGEVTISSTYVLLHDRTLPQEQQQLSFTLTAPVHAVGDVPDAGAFRGWLRMGLRGHDFLAQLLQRSAQGQVEVALTDASTPDQDIPVAAWPRAHAEHRGPQRTVTLDVARRQWKLSVRSATAVTGGTETGLTVPIVAGTAGAVVSVLLAGLVLMLAASRDRALKQVAEATAALREDLVRRKEVEATLRRREVELTGFAAVVAHDLRSPLSVAAGYLDLLTDDFRGRLDDTGRDHLRGIGSGLARMSRLIGDLLDYASAEHTHVADQPVDLQALVVDVLNQRTGQLRPEQRPAVDLTALPTVAGDASMLHQVLDNLISNAIKYTPHGRPAQLTINAEQQPDSTVQITISDRGIGIPDGQHDTVFDAFHRAGGSEGYPGTGLGLAICKRIIERHHGTISAQPNPGGGTRFTITLPHPPRAAPPAPTDTSDAFLHSRL